MIDPDDRKRFRFIMEGLAEDKGVQLSASGIGMKFEALKQFAIEDINRAALSMMGAKKYATMPAVSDFLEYLGGGSVDDRAEIEASKVWKAIIQVGGYSAVCFDDAVTQAVIQHAFGGWGKLCSETMVDQQKWFMRDFVKFYGSFSRQNLRVTGPLLGRGGLSGDKPKLIGDPEKALQIMNTVNDNNRFQITGIPENVRELIGHTFEAQESEE